MYSPREGQVPPQRSDLMGKRRHLRSPAFRAFIMRVRLLREVKKALAAAQTALADLLPGGEA